MYAIEVGTEVYTGREQATLSYYDDAPSTNQAMDQVRWVYDHDKDDTCGGANSNSQHV